MTEGYYWARLVHEKKWVVVYVWSTLFEVDVMSDDFGYSVNDFEFGDYIETPDKYKR